MCLASFFSVLAQTNTQLVAAKSVLVSRDTLEYYVYYPADYNQDKTRDFPLLLYLHGGGKKGAVLESVKNSGPLERVAEGERFPFLILAPLNPHHKMWWDVRAVKQLLDTVVANNKVAADRIYLTGSSRGGGAAWEMAINYPSTFAALAVVCGMTAVPYAAWLDKDMPIWVFHGTDDDAILVSESEEMVKKLKSLGYQVRFTKYEGVGHDAWTRAYHDDALYKWLMMQQRKD